MKKIINNENEFTPLIKKDRFQVFLFVSCLPIPFVFAVHSWIVTSSKGNIKRWEVWQNKNRNKTSWDYVHLNLLAPSTGMNKYPFLRFPRNKSEIIGYIEGEKGSTAEKIIRFLDKKAKNYALKSRYHFFPGPNSNTFTEWTIKKFPKTGWKLPWTAIGKSYRVEKTF